MNRINRTIRKAVVLGFAFLAGCGVWEVYREAAVVNVNKLIPLDKK
jgi:hypothetical protein